MDIHTYIPGEVNHRSAFRILRYGAVGLTLLCVALIAYSMIDVFNDFRLVNKAFPSLSSDFTTDLTPRLRFRRSCCNWTALKMAFCAGSSILL